MEFIKSYLVLGSAIIFLVGIGVLIADLASDMFAIEGKGTKQFGGEREVTSYKFTSDKAQVARYRVLIASEFCFTMAMAVSVLVLTSWGLFGMKSALLDFGGSYVSAGALVALAEILDFLIVSPTVLVVWLMLLAPLFTWMIASMVSKIIELKSTYLIDR